MERESLEQERREQERREQERVEQEKLEQERLEQERLEQESLEQERREQERLEQERLEQERLEQARLEQAKLEQDRLRRERLEQEKPEQERLEQERQDQGKTEYRAMSAPRRKRHTQIDMKSLLSGGARAEEKVPPPGDASNQNRRVQVEDDQGLQQKAELGLESAPELIDIGSNTTKALQTIADDHSGGQKVSITPSSSQSILIPTRVLATWLGRHPP